MTHTPAPSTTPPFDRIPDSEAVVGINDAYDEWGDDPFDDDDYEAQEVAFVQALDDTTADEIDRLNF